MLLAAFHVRSRSLLRATVLVIGGLAMALFVSGFPNARPTPEMIFPVLLAVWGTYGTLRCLRLRWSLYHGSVMLLLYTDVMALAMIIFLLLYPYGRWMQ